MFWKKKSEGSEVDVRGLRWKSRREVIPEPEPGTHMHVYTHMHTLLLCPPGSSVPGHRAPHHPSVPGAQRSGPAPTEAAVFMK